MALASSIAQQRSIRYIKKAWSEEEIVDGKDKT